MTPTSLRYFALALIALVLARPSVRGDYFFSDGYRGKVRVTTYPDSSWLGTPQRGQARIDFDGSWHGSSQVIPETLDTVAFNTDLQLAPSQITVPKGWTITPNAVVPGFGRFSWVLHDAQAPILPSYPLVSITIDGLGNSLAAAHFWQSSKVAGIAAPATPATFAFHDGVIDYYQGPDVPWLHVPQGPDMSWFSIAGPPQYAALTPSPELTSLLLCGVGVAGLLGWNMLRRRRAQAARLVRI